MPVKKSVKAPTTRGESAVEQSASFHEPDEPHWHRLISETAYYLAEQRGFTGGSEIGDWLEAEELVKARLTGKSSD